MAFDCTHWRWSVLSPCLKCIQIINFLRTFSTVNSNSITRKWCASVPMCGCCFCCCWDGLSWRECLGLFGFRCRQWLLLLLWTPRSQVCRECYLYCGHCILGRRFCNETRISAGPALSLFLGFKRFADGAASQFMCRSRVCKDIVFR